MRRWTRSALVWVMACRLVGAKPLSEPMKEYFQLVPCEQASVKFESKYKTFHSWKRIWTCRLRNGGHFVLGKMSKVEALSYWENKNTWALRAATVCKCSRVPFLFRGAVNVKVIYLSDWLCRAIVKQTNVAYMYMKMLIEQPISNVERKYKLFSSPI